MEHQTAIALRGALQDMEKANAALREASDAAVVDAAEEYQRAREAAAPAFTAAQREWDLAVAANPAAAPATPPPPSPTAPAGTPAAANREVAPGVPLVATPGVVVTAQNLGAYGTTATYIPREGDAEDTHEVTATTFAFDAGTAIQGENGVVGTAQPARVVVGTDGSLGAVTQDVFANTWTAKPAEGASGPVDGGPAPQAPAPGEVPQDVAETPVEGGESA
jgi:hypothetical protein